MTKLVFSQHDQKTVLRHKAMDLLARREHSRKELRQKLLQRFPDDEPLMDSVLDALAEDNLQSDQRFAEAFVNARVSKGQGPYRIRVDLKQRGVDEVIIEQALFDCGANWLALARQVMEKKYGGFTCNSYAERGKRSRFLQYRGFDSEQINSVLE